MNWDPSPSPERRAFRFRGHQPFPQLLRLPLRLRDGLVLQRGLAAAQVRDGHGASREFVALLPLLGSPMGCWGWEMMI